MKATTAIMKGIRRITERKLMFPFCTPSMVVPMAGTKPTTMPAKMMSEMPLPIPRSLICSPSHMMNAVPVVSVSTVSMRNPHPGWGTRGAPAGADIRSSQMAMPVPWMIEITTVP